MERTRAVEQAIVRSPFGRALGAETASVEPDRVVVRLPFSPRNVTVGEMVHGGAIASLVDIAATGAAWSGVEDPAAHRGTTIGLSVSYLAAALGSALSAEAVVRRRGRSVCFVDVTVRDDADREVASAQVTYKLSSVDKPRPPAEVFAELFAGKSLAEQQALLATLERGGAALYEQMAQAAESEDARNALRAAAMRELENAELLESKLRTREDDR